MSTIGAVPETQGIPDLHRPTVGDGRTIRVVEEAQRHVADVLASLNTTPDGLNRIEAMVRRERQGPNEVACEKAPPWYVQLLLAYHNPFRL